MPEMNSSIIDFWKSSGKEAFQETDDIYAFYEECIFNNAKDNQNLDTVFLQDKDQRYINILTTQFDDLEEIEDWLIDTNYNVKLFIADFKNQILIYQQNVKISKMEIPFEDESFEEYSNEDLFQEEDYSNRVDDLEEMLISMYSATNEIKDILQSVQIGTDKVGKYSYSVFKWMQDSVKKKNSNHATTLDTVYGAIEDIQCQLESLSVPTNHNKKEKSNDHMDKKNGRFSFTETLILLLMIFVFLLVSFKL